MNDIITFVKDIITKEFEDRKMSRRQLIQSFALAASVQEVCRRKSAWGSGPFERRTDSISGIARTSVSRIAPTIVR